MQHSSLSQFRANAPGLAVTIVNQTRARRKAASKDALRSLRIAQVAPLYERVPPELYGGTERMVDDYEVLYRRIAVARRAV
ncbi:MAG TPA: hypothetical protein VML54_03075 [Candidatus Limnocylindrales bacterium]|nr:hypothetical protein [Candidatus Limnocylindrales bacterium]